MEPRCRNGSQLAAAAELRFFRASLEQLLPAALATVVTCEADLPAGHHGASLGPAQGVFRPSIRSHSHSAVADASSTPLR